MSYKLQISLLGPQTENERGYWNRETLANATLAIEPTAGWSIYLSAVEEAIKGEDD